MLKITFTPKAEIPGGFFLDHDNAVEYLTNCISISANTLLFVADGECQIRKVDCTRYFYDIVSA